MPFINLRPEDKKDCDHPEHKPPFFSKEMAGLRPGNHIWECPSCGQKTIVCIIT